MANFKLNNKLYNNNCNPIRISKYNYNFKPIIDDETTTLLGNANDIGIIYELNEVPSYLIHSLLENKFNIPYTTDHKYGGTSSEYTINHRLEYTLEKFELQNAFIEIDKNNCDLNNTPLVDLLFNNTNNINLILLVAYNSKNSCLEYCRINLSQLESKLCGIYEETVKEYNTSKNINIVNDIQELIDNLDEEYFNDIIDYINFRRKI